jgi:hypothetical protein
MFEMTMKEIGSLAIGIFFISYGAYCMLNSGTHHRRRGWISREESPKAFLFSLAIYFILGLSSIVSFVFVNFR